MENRNGLIVNTEVSEANGSAERDAALVMLEQIPGTRQVTVGGDKRRTPRLKYVRRSEKPSAGHQRMQPKTLPRVTKSRSLALI